MVINPATYHARYLFLRWYRNI